MGECVFVKLYELQSGVTNFLPAPWSTQDLKNVSTSKHIITTIQHDDFLHPLGVEQGYIDNRIHPEDITPFDKDTVSIMNLNL